METFQIVADVDELKWFFENVLKKPMINESYSAVLAARFKKLSEEERVDAGIAKREAEFLMTQTFRVKKIHDAKDVLAEDSWTFESFLRHMYRFNVDKRAYTTSGGKAIPEKCITVIFYVNPCDELKVADELVTDINAVKTGLCKAVLNGKDLSKCLQSYQAFGNIEGNVKRARAHCKGSVYWMDFDLDCPEWFKDPESLYFQAMKEKLNDLYGLGNYLLIDTAGGFHILVKTAYIKDNPHQFCEEMHRLYYKGLAMDKSLKPHVDANGNEKFECIVNDSQIPGLPMPGTYQYGRAVRIINKEDFSPVYKNKTLEKYLETLAASDINVTKLP